MTRARVIQVAGQVVHGDTPAAAGILRTHQIAAQVVRDRSDWVGDFARVVQAGTQVVHGQIPADSGIAKLSQVAAQIVRSVGEAGSDRVGARRSVIVLGM